MNKTVFRQLHLWLSVPFGLIIVLMCLSGAILLFERDFGHIGQVEGKNKIVGVTAYPDADHAYKIFSETPAMAAIWVDQYTGEVIGKYERVKIFKLASAAHRRLFGKSKADGAYGAKTGKINHIIGATLPFTGYYLWIKRLCRKKK